MKNKLTARQLAKAKKWEKVAEIVLGKPENAGIKLTTKQVATLVGIIIDKPVRAEGNRLRIDLKRDFEAASAVESLMLWHHMIDGKNATGIRIEKVPNMKTDDSYGEPFQDGFVDVIKFVKPKSGRTDIRFSEKKGLSIAVEKINQATLLDEVAREFNNYVRVTKLLGNNEKTGAFINALHKARHMAPLESRDALDGELVAAFQKDAHDAACAIHKTAKQAGLSRVLGKDTARYILTKVSGLAP